MSARTPSLEDRQLRILSFNVWGLAFVSKDRPTRIRAIAEYLASAPYDIVCLQEIWLREEFAIIRNEVLQTLPFTRFFRTGAIGSGLAILSRYPFISTRAMPYSLSGSPHQAIAGDFFVNKAAVAVVIRHPALGEVEVWNTHMHAGGEHPPDTRQAHRMAQSWQLANAINTASARGRTVFAMGDFNSQPFSIPIAMLRSHGLLRDSFLEVHPHANDAVPVAPKTALVAYGMTCDSSLNSYSAGKPIPEAIFAQGGKRLDYIFYREPDEVMAMAKHEAMVQSDNAESSTSSAPRSLVGCARVRCVKSEVVLTDLVPGTNFSYSDHFGLSSTFVVDLPNDPFDASTHGAATTSTDVKADSESTSTSKNSVAPLLSLGPESEPPSASSTTTFTPLDPKSSGPTAPAPPTLLAGSAPGVHPEPGMADKAATIRTALHTIRDYAGLASKEARTHLRFFFAAVGLLLALTIGSAWQPKSWIQPIFTLIAGALGVLGATFLYTGFVWGKWEQGLLSETMDEMELELRVMEAESKARAK